ncbi:hypothetical protein B0H66DRAFT_576522 [Apodospora peruviana]|uniref:Uncharacterized protein n=1 Tax=Apodospora peruviana TaxID=516989 RepID=A0AAE0I346_9PEZI|nr:hypothetical protein B0H66DRAFT_576522 [Apodospora peruviana]
MAAAKVYWLKPALMVGGMMLGIVNEQEWYRRVGTGLAFLTNALLVAASTLAHTQLLWRTLKSKAVSIGGVDALFGVTANAWNLVCPELWQSGTLPAAVAVVLWLLPLSVLVTPSTLVVALSPSENVTVVERPVPLMDYAPEKYAQWEFRTDDDGDRSVFSNYLKPASSISRFVANVASSGAILPMRAPFPNSSYSLRFHGPSISCGPAEPTLEQQVNQVLRESSFILTYVGFVPYIDDVTPNLNNTGTNSDVLNGLNRTLLSTSEIVHLRTFDIKPSAGYSRLFIATYYPSNDNSNDKDEAMARPKLIECALYNSSYQVDLSFVNNQQSVNFSNVTRLNGISHSIYRPFNSTSATAPGYLSGIIGCSLMDALAKMLVGYLRYSRTSEGWYNDGEIQIMNTVLMETQELRRLFQPVVQDSFAPVTTEPLSIRNMTIANAIEELSRNMTVSLFSHSYFLQDISTASPIPITVRTPQNAYAYSPRNLVIAYGLVIGFSLAIVIAGLVCIYAAEGAFSASFSTIVRTTRGPQLDRIVQSSETHGKDPLPRNIAETKISLRRRQCGGKGYGEAVDERTSFVIQGATEDVELLRSESRDLELGEAGSRQIL